MKKTFIESKEFTRWVQEHLDDSSYAAFQYLLMENPNSGKVISGCGGLRKTRIAERGRHKGKRGGARVIYLHVPEANWIFLLDVYSKGEKDDLAASEKKTLRQLAETCKSQAIAAASRSKGIAEDE